MSKQDFSRYNSTEWQPVHEKPPWRWFGLFLWCHRGGDAAVCVWNNRVVAQVFTHPLTHKWSYIVAQNPHHEEFASVDDAMAAAEEELLAYNPPED